MPTVVGALALVGTAHPTALRLPLQLPLLVEKIGVVNAPGRERIRRLRDVDDGPIRQLGILLRVRPIVPLAEREAGVEDDVGVLAGSLQGKHRLVRNGPRRRSARQNAICPHQIEPEFPFGAAVEHQIRISVAPKNQIAADCKSASASTSRSFLSGNSPRISAASDCENDPARNHTMSEMRRSLTLSCRRRSPGMNAT